MAIICEKFPKFWVRWEKYIELDLKFAWVRSKIRSELGPQKRKNNAELSTCSLRHGSRRNLLTWKFGPPLLFYCLKIDSGSTRISPCQSWVGFWYEAVADFVKVKSRKKQNVTYTIGPPSLSWRLPGTSTIFFSDVSRPSVLLFLVTW